MVNIINSPLEQFLIFPIFQNLNLLTNSNLIGFFVLFLIGFLIHYEKKIIPTRIEQIIEMIYKTTFELSNGNISKGPSFFLLIFSIFFFLLLCNIIGMVPYSFTITSHLIVTFSLALTLYLGLNILGIKKHKIEFLNLLLPSGANIYLIFLLIPIEAISYVFRVISLPVRLFANMMAGHTLLKVIAGFSWMMLDLPSIFYIFHLIPLLLLLLLIVLELGVALIQSYVFTILICIYINDALNLH